MLLFIGLGKSDKGDTLHCANCGQLLAGIEDLCRIMGRPPRKSYVNPHGLVCPILTLAEAVGLEVDTYASTEHTWFEGYAWSPVACESCGLFLGWCFAAESGASPETFFGLLEERLISRKAPEAL